MYPLPILDVLLALLISVSAHPHNSKAFVLAGAKGKATLSYMTLPYNPEAVKTLQPGTDWGPGIQLDTQMDMTAGDVKIPAASYQLLVRRAQDGEFKEAVLKPGDGEEIVLPIKTFQAAVEEHLIFRVVNHGYVTAGFGSTEAVDGTEFSIMMSFGDLHRRLDLKEVLPAGDR